MIRYYSFPQRSPQWYAMRRGRWTGSTAIDLLSGKNTPPESDSDYDNRYMQRGRILEPLAVEAYEIKYKVSVSHFGFVTNSDYPHAGYSPDGIEVEDPTLLEVKCLGLEKHDAIIAGKLPVPTVYISQIQFGLLITELSKAKLILYNPDSETPLYVIEYEPILAIQDHIKARLEETRPKRRPSTARANRLYRQRNALKIKEKRHERYLRSKQG